MPAPPIHPRPQLRRSEWVDLCGSWNFAFDDEDLGIHERWFEHAEAFDRQITVTYPPESRLSGVRETGCHPVVWYRREFTVDDKLGGECLLLHFGAFFFQAEDGIRDVAVTGVQTCALPI